MQTYDESIVDKFYRREIGLKCRQFKDEHMKELSDAISMYLDFDDRWPTLFDYARDCRNTWDIIICEHGPLNALRMESANMFLEEHKAYTAKEMLNILRVENIEVLEMDIDELFK